MAHGGIKTSGGSEIELSLRRVFYSMGVAFGVIEGGGVNRCCWLAVSTDMRRLGGIKKPRTELEGQLVGSAEAMEMPNGAAGPGQRRAGQVIQRSLDEREMEVARG